VKKDVLAVSFFHHRGRGRRRGISLIKVILKKSGKKMTFNYFKRRKGRKRRGSKCPSQRGV